MSDKWLQANRIMPNVARKLNGIILIRNMPENFVRIVERSRDLQVVVKPCHLIYVGGNTYEVKNLSALNTYKFFISSKKSYQGAFLIGV